MNEKFYLVSVFLVLVFTMSSCGIYGKGETTGYVYAIDDGMVWDKVWYKSSLQSSESDCYLINDDSLKEQLRSLPTGTFLKLKYNRHFMTIANCGNEKAETDDEIISFEIVETNTISIQ